MLESFLREFLIIFAVATGVAIFFRLLKLPTIVGFIISGVIVGPYGFRLISDTETIHQIAELGLVFLLFSIGVEFSIKSLLQMKRVLIGGGTLQFLLVTGVSMGILMALGHESRESFLMGCMMALSSTAIVLKALHQRREIASPHGNLAVGILIFQDLLVVPLMLLVPFLASHSTTPVETKSWLELLVKAAGILGVIVIAARYFIPALFRLIARSGGRELFIIAVALLIIFSAWAAQQVGLSLALGAFIAGLLISESPYGHQATADMVAWRDPLVAIFFVSVGMLLDVQFFLSHPFSIIGATLAILFGKTVLNSIAGNLLGVMQRASLIAGLMLSQVGEFSFILADSAHRAGVIQPTEYQFLLSVIVLSLVISPLIVHATPLLAPQLIKTDLVGKLIERSFRDKHSARIETMNRHESSIKDHVIIIGFGNNGKNLAAALRVLGIPYQAIESNASALQKNPNEPLHFGDGGKQEILEKCGIETARAVVVTINDAVWINKIVASVRKIRPDIRLVVRLQYFMDEARCLNLEGVETVIAEAETAKQITRKVLGFYEIPASDIEALL
jgi:CPA2 family monovalent cation:H+ antiporter-2